MPRLNARAFDILQAEVHRCATTDVAGRVQKNIVLKRLEKLRSQDGLSVTAPELHDTVVDVFPNFKEKVIQSALRANRGGGKWGQIKVITGMLGGTAVGLYILNLPYPMIRGPVANTAPILLLPSFISMDYHYREAIALVEQADQLVNQATSRADLTLGAQKVKQAQNHLDALPVWFLGYAPRYSGFWYGWRFTLDEFKAARRDVGRMEAQVFQEQQAQTQLTQGEKALATARQAYQAANSVDARTSAIAAWQAALDLLKQIPPQTLAGRMVQPKLAASQRDFEQVAGVAAASQRSGTLIEVAQEFARAATTLGSQPPHTVAEWHQAETQWQTAIERLQQVPVEDSGYFSAQKLLATYQTNLGTVQTRLEVEQEAVTALKDAKAEIQSLISHSNTRDRNQQVGQLQSIINQLETIPSQTTAYAEAQELLQFAQEKIAQL